MCCRNECRSPDSVETLSSTWRMLLNKDLFKSAKHWYIKDTNRSTNAKASTSLCPRNRNKQMAEKQNRLIWSVCPSSDMTSEFSECLSSDSVSSLQRKQSKSNHLGSNLHHTHNRIHILTSLLSNRCHNHNSSFLRHGLFLVFQGLVRH